MSSEWMPQMLQWGHVFSDVEMETIFGWGNEFRDSFNGATSFQTWK